MIRIDVNRNNSYFGKFETTSEQAFNSNKEKADERQDNLDALCSALFYIIDSASRDSIAADDLTAALDYARTAIPVSFNELLDSETINAGATPPYICGVDLATPEIQQGDHFTYNGMEFICLDIDEKSIFAIMAKCYDELPFDTDGADGCNNWANSSARRVLNEDLLNEHFDTKHLIKQTTDLTADNGDTKYGTCEDYLTLLTCDQYRKYREFVPLFDECMWTVTPWRCDVGNAYRVRIVYTSGALHSNYAYNTNGLAPACLFNRSTLELRRQAHIELCAKEAGSDND